jgi:deazaflavin-dependent oxidoreductase (nitroreductase family)
VVDRSKQMWVNKAANAVFNRWFRVRKGKVSFRGAPACILHTTGARTGQPRQTPLLIMDAGAGRWALVGSNGGDDATPAWVHNLRAHPDVELEMAGGRRRMRAEVADAATRAELWPDLVRMYRHYDTYQTKTNRTIPVIILRERA